MTEKSEFEKWVEETQQQIIDEDLKVYSKKVVDLFYDPKNWASESMENFDTSSKFKGPCGDTIQFFLKIDNDNIIREAKFLTDGCGASVAAGSMTTILIKDKPIKFARNLKAEDIDKALDGLPDDHKHCALLAVNSLKEALKKYTE
ncbi:MAG: iron-sulfur cluster assembly scaffold protein [Candidatus Lokiarchaeota archaeon]|nr:iron-sulfur cluster assembly scaffold protein [Candidatus Lokiarchaeota archaeon]